MIVSASNEHFAGHNHRRIPLSQWCDVVEISMSVTGYGISFAASTDSSVVRYLMVKVTEASKEAPMDTWYDGVESQRLLC